MATLGEQLLALPGLGVWLLLGWGSLAAASRHQEWAYGSLPGPHLHGAHPYALAHLHGGSRRVLAAAVAALNAGGHLEVTDPDRTGRGLRLTESGERLLDAPRSAAGTGAAAAADRLDRVVLRRLRAGRRVGRARWTWTGALALRSVRADLFDRGALLTQRRRARVRLAAIWPAALVGVHLWWLGGLHAALRPDLVTVDPGGPVLLLLGPLVVLFYLLDVEKQHLHVAGELHRLRRAHAHLQPAMRPALATYGPEGAATAVALNGFRMLELDDRVLAANDQLIGLADAVAHDGDSGHGDADDVGDGHSCGGCGGCGGH